MRPLPLLDLAAGASYASQPVGLADGLAGWVGSADLSLLKSPPVACSQVRQDMILCYLMGTVQLESHLVKLPDQAHQAMVL